MKNVVAEDLAQHNVAPVTTHRLAVMEKAGRLGTASNDHVEPSKGGFSSVLESRNGDAVLVSGESAGTVSRQVIRGTQTRKDKKALGLRRETNGVDTALLCLTLRQAELGRVEALRADSPSSRKVW